jgi:exosome complex component RRP40
VIGIISSRHTEYYMVDVGGPHKASLSFLAFEGATKRNRPNLEVGTLVYARVNVANKDMDPTIECVHPTTGKSDGFGELKDGMWFSCSLSWCRRLLSKDNSLFKEVASLFPFEVAVGMNGRVWVQAESTRHVIVLMNLIKSADGVAPSKIPHLIKACKKQLQQEH